MAATQVFISYAHDDEKLRQSLGNHLAALQREGLIEAWHDRKISAGQEWAGAIDANLEQADIILLLVSASFLASDYCNDIELRRALERHERGEARVIPVILKPADWTSSPFARLQALPGNAKPVTKYSNRDEAFLEVAKGIRQVAQELAERPDPPSRPAPAAAMPPAPRAAQATAPVGVDLAEGPVGLEIPEGPVRNGSPYYIHPADEARCCAELAKPGALIRIKSPKGFGKSSLRARLLADAQAKGYRTVALNLEGTDQKFFANTDLFMQWFCAAVGKGLASSPDPTTTASASGTPRTPAPSTSPVDSCGATHSSGIQTPAR